MPLPDAIRRRLLRQLGLVTRAQARAVGVPEDTVDGWVTARMLEPVERGVYRQPGVVVPDAQRLLAAVLRGGHGARATGWSACALYGIEGFDVRRRPWISIPTARRVRGVAFIVERRDVARSDLATVAGVPAVTPYCALIEVAARVPPKPVRVGIDDARRRRLVDLDRLQARAIRLGRHRGATAVRRMFGSGVFDQDGELERRLALLLADHDLWPTWGVEVLPGVIADACFPDASYIIECDGGRWHTIDSDMAADVTRTGVLGADGWHVDRIRDDDLHGDTRDLVAMIRATRNARVAAGLGRDSSWRPVRAGRRVRPPA